MEALNHAISKYQDMIGVYDKQAWERSIEKAVSQSLSNLTKKKGKVNKDLIDLDLVRGSSFSKIKPRHSWISISRKALYRVLFLPLCIKWWRKCTGVPTSSFLLFLYLLQLMSFYLYTTDNITPPDEALTLSHLLTPLIIYLILAILNTQITSTGSSSSPSSSSSSSSSPPSYHPTTFPTNQTSTFFFPQNKNPSDYMDGGKKFIFPGEDDEEDEEEDEENDIALLISPPPQKEMTARRAPQASDSEKIQYIKKSRDCLQTFKLFKNKLWRGANDTKNINNNNNNCNNKKEEEKEENKEEKKGDIEEKKEEEEEEDEKEENKKKEEGRWKSVSDDERSSSHWRRKNYFFNKSKNFYNNHRVPMFRNQECHNEFNKNYYNFSDSNYLQNNQQKQQCNGQKQQQHHQQQHQQQQQQQQQQLQQQQPQQLPQKQQNFIPPRSNELKSIIPKINFQFENFENDFDLDDEEEEEEEEGEEGGRDEEGEEDEEDVGDSYSMMSLLLPSRERLGLKLGAMLGVGNIKETLTNSTTSSIHSDDDDDDDDEVEEDVMMMRGGSSSSCIEHNISDGGGVGKTTSSYNPIALDLKTGYHCQKHSRDIEKSKHDGMKKDSLRWRPGFGGTDERQLNMNNCGLMERIGLRKRKAAKPKLALNSFWQYQNPAYLPEVKESDCKVCDDNVAGVDDVVVVGGMVGGVNEASVVADADVVRVAKGEFSKMENDNERVMVTDEGGVETEEDMAHDDILCGFSCGMSVDGSLKVNVSDFPATNHGHSFVGRNSEDKVDMKTEIQRKRGVRFVSKSFSYPSLDTPNDITFNTVSDDRGTPLIQRTSKMEQKGEKNIYTEAGASTSVNKLYSAIENKVSCIIWEGNDAQKVDLSVLDIGWNIIKKVDKSCLSYDYFILGVFSSFLLSIIPIIFRTYHSWNLIEPLHFGNNGTDLMLGLQIALGRNWRQVFIICNGVTQRFWLSLILFFMLAVSERTFYQRLLYAKNFCYLTSLRRARKHRLPHFRLNKVRNIKMWLSVRSFLKRRGPQRSVEVIVSVAFLASVIIISTICIEILQDYGCFLDELSNWEMAVWGLSIGVFLLRFITLGTSINKKYRNFSVLITEQINLYLHMEQKPHKKNELMMANSVLKLAEDLLKEVESPFKVSGFSANPLLYNITKVVVLSAFSAVISELLGFKLKLYKIKIRA